MVIECDTYLVAIFIEVRVQYFTNFRQKDILIRGDLHIKNIHF